MKEAELSLSQVELDFATIIYDDGIAHIQFKEGAELEPEHIDKMNKVIMKLSGGKTICTLSDSRVRMTATKEAREYGADNPYTKYRLATAVVVNSTALKLMANFYIRFNKPKIPTRLFEDVNEAKKWLKTFLVKERSFI